MKHLSKKVLFLFIMIPIVFMSCSSDDDNSDYSNDPVLTEINSKIYNLNMLSNSGVLGTAKFIEYNDNTLSIELDLQNTSSGDTHPAHIHFNTAAEGGTIALDLEPVDGETGKSVTQVTVLEDGSSISYQDLVNFDGYINVHLSPTETSTIISQGDIGQNELTGNTMSYDLSEVDVPGVNGTIEFAERLNETTLVTINLTGTTAGESHPAHIHQNDIATTGVIIVGLNPVDGSTGVSKTQVENLVGGTSIAYSEFSNIDAYVNVHLGDGDDLSILVAQGNIGSNDGNEEDNESKTYDVTNSGASAYIFNGEGLSSANNPDFTFRRGSTYTFNVNTPGHPLYINSTQGTGTGNAYNAGVTNNGAVSGVITFTVPSDAPNTLYYNCEFHGSMTGTITITD